MSESTLDVGIIGLGLMGAPMARHLRANGFALACCDLDQEAVDTAVEQGAMACAAPGDVAANSDVVFVIVPTADDLRTVCRGDDGLFARARAGAVLLLCSSLRPEVCAELQEEGAAHGVDVLDAPMTGGIRAAEAGTMTLLVGGDAAALERVRPAMEAVASVVHRLGPIGSGQVGKTVNNLIHWGQIVVITESLALGAKLGLDVETLREALYDANVDSRTLRQLQKMRFTWYEKDLEDALGLAAELGHEMPAAELARIRMRTISPERVAGLLADGTWDQQ